MANEHDKSIFEAVEACAVAVQELVKRAADLETENTTLKTQMAKTKQASSEAVFDKALLEQLADTLIEGGRLKAASRTQFVENMNEEPDAVLKISTAMARTISLPSSGGMGVRKGAGVTGLSDDPDGWSEIGKHGA